MGTDAITCSIRTHSASLMHTTSSVRLSVRTTDTLILQKVCRMHSALVSDCTHAGSRKNRSCDACVEERAKVDKLIEDCCAFGRYRRSFAALSPFLREAVSSKEGLPLLPMVSKLWISGT